MAKALTPATAKILLRARLEELAFFTVFIVVPSRQAHERSFRTLALSQE
jgi:hypothetical protein